MKLHTQNAGLQQWRARLKEVWSAPGHVVDNLLHLALNMEVWKRMAYSHVSLHSCLALVPRLS